MANISLILISLCILLLVIALVAAFTSRPWSPLAAYAPLLILHFTPGIGISTQLLVFWGVIASIAFGINILLPRAVASSTIGTGYLIGASLAGGMVGTLVSPEGIIIGAVAGALCGGIAYSRTPAGKILEFPSRKFLNYLCAKGLPVIVTTCLTVITVTIIYIGLQIH